MKPSTTPKQLLHQLSRSEQQTLILTPNLAIAENLRSIALELSDRSPKPTPAIFSIEHWINQLVSRHERMHSHSSELDVASDDELALIWADAIRASEQEKFFSSSNIDLLARDALQAWRHLRQRNIYPENAKAIYGTNFYRWYRAFCQTLSARKLTTIFDALGNDYQAATDEFVSISLYGFIEPITPFQSALIEKHGSNILEFSPVEMSTAVAGCEFSSAEEELSHVATWAQRVLSKSERNRIAILCPSLREKRGQIERALLSTLRPDQYAFYPPAPLTENLTIRTALSLLNLNQSNHPLSFYCDLLSLPQWGQSDCESDSKNQFLDWRARLETELRLTGAFQLSTLQFRELAATALKQEHSLLHSLNTFQNQYQNLTRFSSEASPYEWATLFDNQLETLGWTEQVSRFEYKAPLLEIWRSVLDRLAACSNVVPTCGLERALSLLNRICATEQQPKTNPNAVVSILDTVESAVSYTHVWVLESHQYQWPQPPRPSNLLPIRYQIEHELPRTSVAKELVLSKKLLTRLNTSGGEVIFSYASLENDRIQTLTPLLELDIQTSPKELEIEGAFSANPTKSNEQSNTVKLELVDCTQGPVLSTAERENTRGGAALLQHMAACPCSAFVIHRLGGREFPEPIVGLSPMERGIATHRCLEVFWNSIHSQSNLQNIGENDLSELCEKIASDTLNAIARDRFEPLTNSVIAIEVSRQRELLTKWLKMESDRSSFSVLSTEQSLHVPLGPLNLKLKVDRIDRIEAEAKDEVETLIIDYKTGNKSSTNRWLTLPPEEPQLPLYAISSEQTPSAIAFGQINSHMQELNGISNRQLDQINFRTIENWNSLIENWKSSLEGLAEAYAKGKIPVTAKLSFSAHNRDSLASVHRWTEAEEINENL